MKVETAFQPAKETINDVSEVYSPPRIVARARHHGLRFWCSLDLTTCSVDGELWNFSIFAIQKKAVKPLEEEEVEMLIFSPICGPFSSLQGLNYSKVTPEDVEAKLREGMIHLQFALSLCKMQVMKGRLFMLEHTANARSWQSTMMREAMRLPNVMIVDFDACYFGMQVEGLDGSKLVKKRTRILTNSTALAKRFSKDQCTTDHEHIPLTNFRAKPCQEYTAFCDEVCMAIKDEFHKGRIGERGAE